MRRHDEYASIPLFASSSLLMRIARAVSALVLALSMSTIPAISPAAWAAETKAAIGIEGIEDDAEVNVYRVISVNCDEGSLAPEDPMFSWTPEIRDWVKSQFPSYIDDAGNVSDEFNDDLSDPDEPEGQRSSSAAASFYSKLAAAISSGSVHVEAAGTRLGNGTIEEMELGSYLVLVERGLRVYRPSSVSLIPAWDENSSSWATPSLASVVPKSSEAPIVKTVNGLSRDTGKMGEEVLFEISASVPLYPDDARSTAYSISDTLPLGLTLIPETLRIFGTSEGNETELHEGDHYSNKKEGGETFRLEFVYDTISQYEGIRIEYAAQLNGDAVVGPDANPNKAVVRYANDPFSIDSSAENTSEATMLSYGVEILKASEDQLPLSGAEFSLASADDPSTALEFVQESQGRYRLALPGEEGETSLETNTDGTLFLEGVDCGEYLITETKASNGYLKPNAALPIAVSDENKDGTVDGPSQTPGFVFVQIRNTQGFTLPATGGIGIALIVAIGIASIASAIVLRIASSKRRSNSVR